MPPQIFTLKFNVNRCYLIKDKGVIMIDGAPPHMIESFKKQIRKINITPEEIRLVILTHADFDHCGSAFEIQQLTGAKVALHENDKATFEEARFNWPEGISTWGKISRSLFTVLLKNKAKFKGFTPDIILNGDFDLSEYGIKGKIIHTPGHTKGSVGVLLDSGEFFAGCMAHNGMPFRFSPGLPIYAEDKAELLNTWKNILKYNIKTIYPAHGDPFSPDVIRKIVKLK